MRVRLFIDDPSAKAGAVKLFGPIADLWPRIEALQAEGYNAYIVVNEGGDTDGEISGVRALYIDADDKPLPKSWQVKPDFLTVRDATHWHAYWRTAGVPVEAFRTAQRQLIERYGTDKSIHNPSRVTT